MSQRKRVAVAAPPHGRRPHPILIHVALVALNVAVFAAVRNFQFVNWDDPSYILENAHVLKGLNWETARWAITTGYSPYWHPLTWLSHLLDVSLFGLDAGAHHVTNLVIHIANTLLVFELFRRMTRAVGSSAFVAAIFAVHPLHVESVAWVAERKDVLSTFFWALAIRAYVGYVHHDARLDGRAHARSAGERYLSRRYGAVMALFVLALMSKPMVVTLPIVLLLLDVWPLGRMRIPERLNYEARSPGRLRRGHLTPLIVEKVPLLALAAATAVATVLIQSRVGAMASLDALPWHLRLSNAIVGYTAYIWKTFWPVDLAAFYPLRLAPVWMVALAAAALLGATAAVVRHRERHPYLLVGWLWYVVTIAPVIGLLQAGEQARADRFTYVPMIGLLLIVAWGVPDLLRRFARMTDAKRTRVLATAAVIVIGISAVAARAQVQHWFDSVTLWRHATLATPDSYIAYENLAQALRERAELDESLAHYQRALALAPNGSPHYEAVIHNSIGLVLTRQGRTSEAMPHFASAVRLNPRFAEPHSNLGNALASDGRFGEAIEQYRAAVALKPDAVEPRVGLGGALLSQGNPAEAIPHYQEALRLNPDLAQAHNGLGAALAMQGKDDEAMTHYSEAIRLNPDLPTTHFNIAVLLVKQGKNAEAKRRLQSALAIDPGYAAARELLARLESLRL